MIEVSSLIRKIRFKTRDNDEITYSDYELLSAINDTLDYMSSSYALQNSDFLEREKIYETKAEPKEGELASYPLPSDMSVLISINDCKGERPLHPCPVGAMPKPWEYKVVDEKIYTNVPKFKIVYRRRLEEIESKEDDIDLPPMFERVIRDSALAILTGSGAGTESVLEDALQSIIPRRRYAHARIPMPF